MDRAISFYYYSLRNKDHTLTKFLIENSISLQEFLSLTEIDISSIDVPLYVKTELQLILFNGQTKFIAGSQFKLKYDYSKNGLQNIESGKVIAGTVERIEDSLIMFKHQLKWKKPLVLQHNNKRIVTQKIENISSSCVDKFKKNNEVDYMLYQTVSRKLDEQLKNVPFLNIKRIQIKLGNIALKLFVKMRGQ